MRFQKFHLNRFLLLWIEDSSKGGHIFSLISEFIFTTFNPIRKMIFESYLERPKSLLENTLRRKLDENPCLIIALHSNFLLVQN